jgi:hypothetical protein
VPVQGLHLDEDDRDEEGAALGMTVSNLGRRAKGGDEDEPADILSVAVPLDGNAGRFCIFGTAEQLYAFAAELVGAVASHLDAEPAGDPGERAAEMARRYSAAPEEAGTA